MADSNDLSSLPSFEIKVIAVVCFQLLGARSNTAFPEFVIVKLYYREKADLMALRSPQSIFPLTSNIVMKFTSGAPFGLEAINSCKIIVFRRPYH